VWRLPAIAMGSNECSALTPRIECLHCRCLDHWGGWEDALGLFEAIEVAMRVTEAAPNEKVSLLQKIAAVSVPLNKTEDGSPSLFPVGCRMQGSLRRPRSLKSPGSSWADKGPHRVAMCKPKQQSKLQQQQLHRPNQMYARVANPAANRRTSACGVIHPPPRSRWHCRREPLARESRLPKQT